MGYGNSVASRKLRKKELKEMSNQSISNAPRNFDMNTFMAISSKYGGLARSCKFAVVINKPTVLLNSVFSNSNGSEPSGAITNDLTYLCEVAEFPGRGFQSIDVRYYGPSFKLPYQSSYEDINLTFLCRSQSYERQFFDDWMNVINPNNTFDFEYKDNYKTKIYIYQFDEQHNPQYAFTLIDCHPILVNPQPVTWADDQFLRLGVSFTYQWWVREGLEAGLPSDINSNRTFRVVENFENLV